MARLPAASATRRRSWCWPGELSVKLPVKCVPVTVARPNSRSVVTSVMRTRKPVSGRSPARVTASVLVRPSVLETPVSGVMVTLLGTCGRMMSITHDSATLPVPALPARSRRPAPATLSV